MLGEEQQVLSLSGHRLIAAIALGREVEIKPLLPGKWQEKFCRRSSIYSIQGLSTGAEEGRSFPPKTHYRWALATMGRRLGMVESRSYEA